MFCLTAGKYKTISSQTGPVPMTLLISPSSYPLLSSYSSFIFDTTQKTMQFLSTYFSESFPFKKYDQIFVRGLKFLAM